MLHNFLLRHIRKYPDRLGDIHYKLGHPHTPRYLDNYILPFRIYPNNLHPHWRHRHIRIPNYHPSHIPLLPPPAEIMKSLHPNWRSNLTNPFWEVLWFSFYFDYHPFQFLLAEKAPRLFLRNRKYKAYHNNHERYVEPFLLVPKYE